MLIEAKNHGVLYQFNKVITNIIGSKRVRAVEIAAYNVDENRCESEIEKKQCDLVVYSGGWSPAVHLHSQS